MSERVAICLPDGRWLALSREAFERALCDGQALAARPESVKPANDAPVLVDAAELARQTGVAPSWWEAAARDSDCPALFVGKVRRFKLGDCLRWLERVQERDANGRVRRCGAAPRARP